MHTLRIYSFVSLIIIGGFFLSAPVAYAATMPAFSYTIGNNVKGATTTYTFSFTTATNIGVAPASILNAVWPFGFTVNDIANVSVTVDGVPKTMDASGFLGSRLLFARITSAVPAGSHVVVTVANVLNHSSAGTFAFQTNPYTADDQGATVDTPASVDSIVVLDVATYTLNYVAGAHGSISGTATQMITSGGNATSVTAVPNANYHFTSWSDASTTNPRTDTNVVASATRTASFAINTHTVTYAAGAGGTLTGTLSQAVDHGSSTVAVLAVPDNGFQFTSWSDASTTNPRTDTGVASDLSVTAQFTAIPAVVEERSSPRRSGGSVQSQVINLISMGNTTAADALKAQYPDVYPRSVVIPASAAGQAVSSGVRDLELGMSGEDVRSLQKLLNENGAVLASSGVGSVGNETDFFGTLTKQALAKYQAEHGIKPPVGYFGIITRTEMASRSLPVLWW